MFDFLKIWRALFHWNTRFEIRFVGFEEVNADKFPTTFTTYNKRSPNANILFVNIKLRESYAWWIIGQTNPKGIALWSWYTNWVNLWISKVEIMTMF